MRAEMEQAFGESFAGVRSFAGGEGARSGLSALGAKAATRGQDVVFRDSAPDKHLVAHELAHVVQQRGGSDQVQLKGIGEVGGSAENRADAAADAVVAGRPVPEVGAADSDLIHLAVDTYGGTWDTDDYTATNNGVGVGKGVGAHIRLRFTPGELVTTPTQDSIGLTQSVKTLRSTAPGGAVDDPSSVGARNTALSLTAAEGDEGRAIDQGDGGNGPNTNPLYAVENPAAPAAPSATLNDVGADARFGQHGHRVPQGGGGFDVQDAILDDTPGRTIAFVGQEWEQKFEATAIVLEGPLANTYLGAIEWGWNVDAVGDCTVDPADIAVVSMGAPTSDFMDAAQKWNDAEFDDGTGTMLPTADLPISGHQTVDPATLSDEELHRRMRVLADQLMGMDRASVDYQQARFESRGLAAEAVRRGASANDSGNVHRARAGDSLWRIAERELGAGVKWTQIFALNRADILDPNRIEVGQELKMPEPYQGGQP